MTSIGFAEVAGAIIGAIGLALGLEWVTLNRLMHMMPKDHGAARSGKFDTK